MDVVTDDTDDDAEDLWDGLDDWFVDGTSVADAGEDLLNPAGARFAVGFAICITPALGVGVGVAEALDS